MTNEELAAAAEASDPDLKALYDELPELWAQVPADSDGEEFALGLIRAAYCQGYMTATKARVTTLDAGRGSS